MFFHIYRYRLKSIFRKKTEFFWILLFPLLLGTCFFAGFHNISNSLERFDTLSIAIVYEDEADNTFFEEYIKALENSSFDNDRAILKADYTDREKGLALLSDQKITGLILVKENIPSILFQAPDKNEMQGESAKNVKQSILKELMDQYVQSLDIIRSVDPSDQKTQMAVLEKISDNTDHILENKLTDGNMDVFTDYYYSLIAMTCLFGAYAGQSCVNGLKANLSAQGMRKCLSCAGRMTMILGDFFATCTFPVISNIVCVFYLTFVLKVNLGGSLGLIILTTVIGSVIGVANGLFIGALPGPSQTAKEGIISGFSLFSSFLSGLMVGGIKYNIEKTASIINRINPATVITDALYSLNVYDTYDKYISCMVTLCVISVIMCILSYLMIRRQSYASI